MAYLVIWVAIAGRRMSPRCDERLASYGGSSGCHLTVSEGLGKSLTTRSNGCWVGEVPGNTDRSSCRSRLANDGCVTRGLCRSPEVNCGQAGPNRASFGKGGFSTATQMSPTYPSKSRWPLKMRPLGIAGSARNGARYIVPRGEQYGRGSNTAGSCGRSLRFSTDEHPGDFGSADHWHQMRSLYFFQL